MSHAPDPDAWMNYTSNPCAETARGFGAWWISQIMRGDKDWEPAENAIRWMEEAVRLAPKIVTSVPRRPQEKDT